MYSGLASNQAFAWLKDNEGRYFLAVDTHIQRLANRTGYAKGKTVDQTEQDIIKKRRIRQSSCLTCITGLSFMVDTSVLHANLSVVHVSSKIYANLKKKQKSKHSVGLNINQVSYMFFKLQS